MKAAQRFGPGLLVAAAFVGPGTVTTATVAGARFGFALLWALAFSVVATIVLQEMSARLGLVTRQGLGEALRTTFRGRTARWGMAILVVGAIGLGNGAYQAGNITGAAMGLSALTGMPRKVWVVVVGAAAFTLLAAGRYRALERTLVALVAVMGVTFVATAVLGRPGLSHVLDALRPSIPRGSLTTIIALIGTTVVPYNLFLHASAVREKWPASASIAESFTAARLDGALSIGLGGLITLAIMATATIFYARGTVIESPVEMAAQLRPILGPAAELFFGVGLFAAGLTSAITAPLAAAYATAGVLGWSTDLRAWPFRTVWAVIVIVGAGFAFAGERPIDAILVAQAANGLLLPIVACFLLVAMNRRTLLGEHVNRAWANVLGAGVVLIVTGLGVLKILNVLNNRVF